MSGPPSNSIEFRPLRRSDRDQYLEVIRYGIGKLERSTGLDEISGDLITTEFRPRTWFLLGFLRAFGRPILSTQVAMEGRRMAGTGMAIWLPGTAYVAGIATRPEFRGRGVASRILTLLGGEAARRRRAWMALDVESENETAIRVYRKAGYHDVAGYTWFSRSGFPAATAPPDPRTTLVSGSIGPEVVAALDRSRTEEYRTIFPTHPRVFQHNEFLVRGPGVKSRSWLRRGDGGGLGLLHVYFSPKGRLGGYFLTAANPEPRAEELVGLLDAAAEWIRPLRPTRCLAVAPEPRGPITAALEGAGFAAVAATRLMAGPASPRAVGAGR